MKFSLFIILCVKTFLQHHASARYSQYYHPQPPQPQGVKYGAFQFITPQPLTYEHFQRVEETHHLLNMSAELLKDIHVKSVHSYHIQQSYSHTEKYKIGIIVAGVTDKFNHMVKMFKYYARPEIYLVPQTNRQMFSHATNILIQAYQVMQGEYNEIRLENDLFMDLMSKIKRAPVVTGETDRVSGIAAAGSVSGMGPGGLGGIGGGGGDITATLNIQDYSELTEEEKIEKAKEFAKEHGADLEYSGGGIITRRQDSRMRVNDRKVRFTVDAAQEEFKRSLRYQKWAEKWRGFDPKVEGIEISNPLENMGRNQSLFLGVNAF